MSRLWARVAGLFSSKSFIGVDKTGNKYFSRMDEIDGLGDQGEKDGLSLDEKRTQPLFLRKRAPTPEEMAELEARRERVKLNVALLKKEEEEKKAREGTGRKIMSIGKVEGPDLTSFVRHFPAESKGDKPGKASEEADESRVKEREPEIVTAEAPEPKTTEPSGSGSSFRPGTWQPPS